MVMGSLRVLLLSAQSADETTSEAINCAGWPNIAIYITGAGTTSSGVITIEEADFDPRTAATYTGTWSSVTTVNASDVTGGAQKAVHFSPGAYGYVRTRISTAIGGGGTISTALRAS